MYTRCTCVPVYDDDVGYSCKLGALNEKKKKNVDLPVYNRSFVLFYLFSKLNGVKSTERPIPALQCTSYVCSHGPSCIIRCPIRCPGQRSWLFVFRRDCSVNISPLPKIQTLF